MERGSAEWNEVILTFLFPKDVSAHKILESSGVIAGVMH